MSTLGALYGHSSSSPSSIRKGKSSSSSSNHNYASNSDVNATSSTDSTSTNQSSTSTPITPRRTIPRQSILLLGLRRSGKTSILKVVHGRLSPNDTLFLDSTTKPNHKLVDCFNPIRFWDLPGSNQSYTYPLPSNQSQSKSNPIGQSKDKDEDAATGPPDYHQISAIIFVIDSQDDYFDSLSTLHETILKVHRVNRKCQFHVFIHKVDGLSDDYKWDTQRDIEQRIFDDLSDASGSFLYSNSSNDAGSFPQSSSRSRENSNNISSTNQQFSNSSSTSQFSQINLETSVPLTFHLTSIFDSSVFIAFSRVQSALVNSGLADAVEGVCSSLCTSCTFDKVMLFDVPSRTYIGLDAGPFDAGSFDVASEYVSFLGEMSSLYSNLPRRKSLEEEESTTTETLPPNALIDKSSSDTNDEDEEEIENQGRYASSCARLNPDTTVGFWQMNNHLALIATLRTEAYQKQAGLIDYNVTFFRRAVQQLYEMAQYGGNER